MLARTLIAAWLCLLVCIGTAGPLAAQEPGHEPALAGAGAAEGQHGETQQGDDGHAERLTLEMSGSEFFARQYSHSVPYAIFPRVDKTKGEQAPWWAIYNVQPWQWVTIGLLFVFFLPVVFSFGKGRPGWLVRVLRGFCLWVRDDLVYAVMGKEIGKPFVPFFMFVFFWLVAMNSIGMIPGLDKWFGHGFPFSVYTATGTPYVTGALAIVTLAMMLFFGMKKNGVAGFWKGLVPHGLPLPLVPIMFVIEFISLLVKPFALTIRLFANMLAGHLLIGSAIGLIFLFAKLMGGSAMSYLTLVPCVGMAVFIYIIEAFVTLLQAYIFTLLSVTFVYQAVHQEH